jgi:DNA-binding beta-propeller fold protein YncE
MRLGGAHPLAWRAPAMLVALALAAPARGEPLVVPGNGPARSDCLAAWVLDAPPEAATVLARKTRFVCTDGDPACDADATADGRCSIRAQVCFGIETQPDACTPGPAGIYDLVRPSRREAERFAAAAANRAVILDAVAALGQPIPAGACTGDVLLDLPLRHGRRPGKAVLKARARGADGRSQDTDLLRVVCRRGTPAGGTQRFAAVLASDFTSVGTYAVIPLDPPRRPRLDLGETHFDAVARAFGDRLYVINRLGQDNIQTIDPDSGASVTACSVGNGTNPQDIAFASSEKAYVSRFADGIVSIVDPTVPRTCAGFARGRVDLRRFADADGIAELGRMAIIGDRLYVTVLRLDRARGFLPAGRGVVAVIDTTTDSLVDVDPLTPEIDAIPLSGTNPFGMSVDRASGLLWVWESGNFFVVGDGGIEAIDPATNRTLGFIATEEALGGTVTVAAPFTAERAFAVVADPDFRNHLVAFSPATGQADATLHTTGTFLPDVEVNDRGEVWLADRDPRTPGIRIFDAVSGDAIAGPIDVGLPPFDIVFLP